MARLSFRLFLPLALGLSGCAISVAETAPREMCSFQAYRLDVQLPDIPGQGASAPAGRADTRTVARRIRDLYQQAPPVADPSPLVGGDDSMLFLSGGSQEGAFGAGVLVEWNFRMGGAENARDAAHVPPGTEPNPGRLPNFRVVTGISTGAILATPAFINRIGLLVDHDPPVAGDPAAHNGYSIRREDELLRPIAGSVASGFNLHSAISTVRRGAVADLRPLRDMLLRELGPDELIAVARGHAANRLLLAGVVDVDSGQAVALDLTEMASRFAAARSAGDAVAANRFHNCYVDAVVASSSAPLAALPVFIDNRMYVDGGARFGLFSDEIDRVIDERAKDPSTPEAAVERRLAGANVYAIVNGDLVTRHTCGRRDRTLCRQDSADSRYVIDDSLAAHADWRLPDLAFRSERILVNQVQRMSLERINATAKRKDRRFFPAWIQPDNRTHPFEMDQPSLGEGSRTCAQWRERDAEIDRPVQFHPREMHCLIDYGRWEFDHYLNWHRPPAPPPTATDVVAPVKP